ncbi:3-carboxymuconate cyclase [Ameyamaea chiangmaiensis NBRC 103196]|uniref:Lactonase family protein n=1 Tax=Ameyamaea chiangmaiensis TaxID=442969 RepID=A0A850P5S4_9PROT|nr:lactonase family protein [Ameyamaea chiangmaiensis]MBS4073739.1 lactonase family protein [Ameyamaea chiangmaiensis]NVN39995.1 lactonase family protein [Ameyamaea chiangmaiensis]GBQ68626.1 3-carboxymuconate cyclase [Ameyamaea chiangmaiensis NBRC 103196]
MTARSLLSRRRFGLGAFGAGALGTLSITRTAFGAPTLDSGTGENSGLGPLPAKGPRILCYVGGYTKHAPPGGAGNGQGIATYELNLADGSLVPRSVFTDIASPSFITLSPDHRFLYALSEIDDYNAGHDGSVTAFSIDPATGALRKINTVSSGGSVPAHLSVHKNGRFVLVANYVGGSIAVLPIKPDGSLGEATDVYKATGPKMPERAADNPPGNFAVSDHSGSHMHMVHSDPSGNFVLADDAGLDRVYVWKLSDDGKLVPAKTPFITAEPGSAPRHFAFSPDGRILYNLGEQDSRVVVSDFDPQTGEIKPRQSVSTVTEHFRGSTLAAEILVGPKGDKLYVSNRLGDSLAVFHIAADGSLTLIEEIWMHADYGRALMFEPTGRYLFCTNQRSDSITSFKVDPATGKLSFTWKFTPIGSPTTMAFVTLKA